MKFIASIAPGLDQASLFEYVQVLRYGLPGGTKLVLRGQPGTDLEQCLSIPVGELIEDLPSGGIGQGLEDVAHVFDNRQAHTCMSTRPPTFAPDQARTGTKVRAPTVSAPMLTTKTAPAARSLIVRIVWLG